MFAVAITSAGELAGEADAARWLISAGLRLHLRKPGWDRARLEAWLTGWRAEERWLVTLHGDNQTARELGCGGAHHPGAVGGVAMRGSRSAHTVEELRGWAQVVDYALFSPVFASVSKPGHGPTTDLERLAQELAAAARPPTAALGGVTADNASQCRDLGFEGVASLGWLWAPLAESADGPAVAARGRALLRAVGGL